MAALPTPWPDAPAPAMRRVPDGGDVGRHLRELRTARGWSQEALALAAGVAASTVGDVEAGRVLPKPATCRKLADAFALVGRERATFLGYGTPQARAPRGQFGCLLRRYRLRAGRNQSDLAASAGCDPSWIVRLEVDARQATAPMVRALAAALTLTTLETDALLAAAGHAPAWASDRTVQQVARLLAGDAVLATALRCQVAALARMTDEGDEG